MSVEWILLYLLLGSLVGFLAGLLGVGGGGLLVPMLTSLFIYQGMAIDTVVHQALGTAMAVMIVSSLSSIRAHAARGAVEWPAVRVMAPGIIVGGFLATFVAAAVSSVYIALFFSLFMALIAVQLFLNWTPRPAGQEANFASPSLFSGSFLVNRSLWAGVGIGAVSALAAVGGGFLTVAFLTYKNIEIKRAIGTSAAMGFFIALAGSCGYMISGWSTTAAESYTIGFIYLPAFFAIATASLVAAPFGVRWSHRLPAPVLKKIFAVVALALSVKMFISVI